MALIKCPECGREISDKAVSCPGCGWPVEASDNQTDLEKLVDEIYFENSTNKTVAVKKLQKATGMYLIDAKNIMDKKFQGASATEVIQKIIAEQNARERNKEMQRQNIANLRKSLNGLASLSASSKVVRCPKCRSTSISYQDKVSVGRAAMGGMIAGPAGAVLGGLTGKKGYAICLNCGKRWKV